MNSLQNPGLCVDVSITDSGCTIDPISAQDVPDLFSFIGQNLAILWKDWPKNMEASSLNNGQFSLRGICPYPDCARPSVFIQLAATSAGITMGTNRPRLAAIMQCQGCQHYILAIVDHMNGQSVGHRYLEHYPIGAPNQAIATEIPVHIAEDFKEALRCMFVNAYNATAEMCRRAMEATCLDLGAPPNKVLEKMIDWLEAQRIITPYLKEAAHKVRLGGNRGAHPPATPVAPVATPAASTIALATPVPAIVTVTVSPVERIEKEHAEAIVEFTREFFHHVYVGPKLLGKYDFSKPKTTPPSTP